MSVRINFVMVVSFSLEHASNRMAMLKGSSTMARSKNSDMMTEFCPLLAWQLENINVARIKASSLVLEHRRSTIPWQEEG